MAYQTGLGERTVLREYQNGCGYIGISLLNFGGERGQVCVFLCLNQTVLFYIFFGCVMVEWKIYGI